MGGGIWICLNGYSFGLCCCFGFGNNSPLGQFQGLATFDIVGIGKAIEGDEILLAHSVAGRNGAEGLATANCVTSGASSDCA